MIREGMKPRMNSICGSLGRSSRAKRPGRPLLPRAAPVSSPAGETALRHPGPLITCSFAFMLAALAAGCGGASRAAWVAAAKKAPLKAGPGEEVVTATATAPGTGAEAFSRACAMAKRRAVALALARVDPPESHDPFAAAAHNRIRDRWADYVRPVVTVRARDASGDATTVTLEVVVMSDLLRSAAARARAGLDPSRRPRVMAVICPVFADGDASAAREAERSINETFTSHGFRLVPEVGPATRDAIVSAFRRKDARAMARSARSAGAEVVLVGLAARTRRREVEVYGRKVFAYTPAVTLEAVDTASAGTVFSREHSGEETIGEAALANAAADLASECLDAIASDRSRAPRALSTAVVRMNGISFEDFAGFVRLAGSVPGVAAVRARPFAEGSGEVEIAHARDPLDLARELARLEGLRLRVVRAGAGDIRMESIRPVKSDGSDGTGEGVGSGRSRE